MSNVTLIKTIMVPPETPSEVPSASDWIVVEAVLGIELPVDYKQFVDTFGTGAIDGFLWVLNPISRNPNLNLIVQSKKILEAQRKLSEDPATKIDYSFHPDVPGLFPWAVSDNGDVVYWHCNGDPFNWPVVISDGRASMWREYATSASEFIYMLLTRDLVIDIFPSDFPSVSPVFIAHPERRGR